MSDLVVDVMVNVASHVDTDNHGDVRCSLGHGISNYYSIHRQFPVDVFITRPVAACLADDGVGRASNRRSTLSAPSTEERQGSPSYLVPHVHFYGTGSCLAEVRIAENSSPHDVVTLPGTFI